MLNKINKVIDKVGVYVAALVVCLLNLSLAFDNVVWGDEAYSHMAIANCSLYGIYERVYYWDSHPPFYYYYLRLFADLFGYKTPVYHIASLVPFAVGIVLACTVIKKKLGSIPALFFIFISGLSASCVEYNLEIRMYALAFMFVLLCAWYALRIVMDGAKLSFYVCMTVFGIFAAYTHYYGLAICGLIIFFAGLFGFIADRNKKNLFSWIISTLIYIVAYIPWLFVLYFQTQAELGNSWMTEPDPLNRILSFISGGDRLKPVVFTYVVVMTVVLLVIESGLLSVKAGDEKLSVVLGLHKPSVKNISPELKTIVMLWLAILGLLGFGYGVSYAFHPILTGRYTYVVIPLILLIVCLCTKRLLEFKITEGCKYGIVGVVLVLVLILSLLDFKYFRSVTKTQDYQTSRVLETVGTPNEDAVLCANNVKHLAWTVLQYYYPNEVTMDAPNKLGKEPSEIWAFAGYVYEDDILDDMEDMGYKMESYMDMWLGKYAVNLYHFYK